MPYLKKIVQYINSELEKKLFCQPVFDLNKVICIAQSLPRQNGDILELIPSYVDEKGEGCYIGPDDDFDLIVYHRVNSITPSKSQAFKTFGDAPAAVVNLASMSMVVFGIRANLKYTNDELAIYLQSNFPDEAPKALLKELNFKTTTITINNINLNDLAVFREEFQNIGYFLKPEQYLLKINYTIESTFLKNCFTKDCNCN